MANERHSCFACGKSPIDKDVVALNKKLRGEQVDKFYCLPCFAESLECSEEELLEKIDEFKAEGCKLFG